MVVRIDDPRLFRTDPETGEVYQVMSYIDELGREVPDPVPLVLPLDIKPTPTLEELVQRVVASYEVRRQLQEQGWETPEEADDFQVEEDASSFDHVRTPYEKYFDPDPSASAAPEVRDGKGGAEAPPAAVTSADRKVSEDSSSEQSKEKTAEKPKVA